MRRTGLLIALWLAGWATPALAYEWSIVTGGPAGTYIKIGREIGALVANFGIQLEAQASAGSIENVEAVFVRPLTPLGIVQSDVLEYLKTYSEDAEMQRRARRVKMVFPLYNEEIHILARKGISRLADLAGRKVAIGQENSGTFLTATYLLLLAGVTLGEEVALGGEEALAALRAGRVDAMIYVAGYPVDLFTSAVGSADGLQLVPITEPGVLDFYPASTIPAGTYPWQTEPVPVAAVKAVLMTYGWRDNPDFAASAYLRAACADVGKIARIVADNIDWLRANGHPKWRQAAFDEGLALWQRDACVEAALRDGPSYPLPHAASAAPTVAPEADAAGTCLAACASHANQVMRSVCEIRCTR